MATITLDPEDANLLRSKEYEYRCPCGEWISSDENLVCPGCGTEYIWPETRGYKRLIRAQKAAAADLKAKERNAKASEAAQYLLNAARLGHTESENKLIIIRTFLTEAERNKAETGHPLLTEMQVIDADPENAKLLAEKFLAAGETGRPLIKHVVNALLSGAGEKKVAAQDNYSRVHWAN